MAALTSSRVKVNVAKYHKMKPNKNGSEIKTKGRRKTIIYCYDIEIKNICGFIRAQYIIQLMQSLIQLNFRNGCNEVNIKKSTT